MTSLLRKSRRITALWTRHPRMVCSLAAALVAVPAFAQQPYGAGARPVATFATPYPSIPAPGPVRPWVDAQQDLPVQQAPYLTSSRLPVNHPQPAVRPATPPRPGGAPAPGAAGKVMYFHKSEGALVPDGLPDSGAVAMAARTDLPAV